MARDQRDAGFSADANRAPSLRGEPPLEAGEARVPFKDEKQLKNNILFKNLLDFVKK